MSLTKIREAAVRVIRDLPNRPTGTGYMTAAALKAAFDQAAENIKTAVNQMIGQLESSGGAAEIGFQRSTEVPADNVQDAIDNVQQQLQASVQDPRVLPNGSVTTEKLDSDAMGWTDVTSEIDPDLAITIPMLNPVTNEISYFTIELPGNSAGINLVFKFSPVLKIMAVTGSVSFTKPEENDVRMNVTLDGGSTYRPVNTPPFLAKANNGEAIAELRGGDLLRIWVNNMTLLEGDIISVEVSGWYFCDVQTESEV